MKLIIALAAVLSSAALTVPTVTGPDSAPEAIVASAGPGEALRA